MGPLRSQYNNEYLWKIVMKGGAAGLLLFLRPILYIAFTRQRDLSAYSAIDTSALVFIFYSVVCAWVGLRVILRSETAIGKDILFHSPMIWFLAYTLLGVVSMAWSVSPALSGFRAFECLAMTLLFIAIVQTLLENGGTRLIPAWMLLFCTWDTIFAIARTLQWTTGLEEILNSSQMMSTTFFFMALYYVPWNWYSWLIFAMSIFSLSTVAYIGMALGSISSFWGSFKARIVAVVAAFAVVLAIIAVGPKTLLKDTLFFDKEDISMEQTSGRDKLMAVTLESLEQQPMGYGFFAAEPYLLYSRNLGAISAHNSLFSAAMGMGMLGVILISIFFVSTGISSFSRTINPHIKPILIGCFCVAFLHCMGNPAVGTRVYGAWTPCMLVFVTICGCRVYGQKWLEPEDINEDESNPSFQRVN